MIISKKWLPALLLICSIGLVTPGCDDPAPPNEEIPDWDGSVTVDPPMPPTLPDWSGACPDGWRPVPPDEGDGVGTCDPWPETGQEECAADEVHFPGEPRCRRIGTDCPSESWPAGLPASNVLYVSSLASSGGDGSKARPYRTIVEATSRAHAGDTIALSKGTYRESVELRGGVILRGACVSGTTLRCSDPTLPGIKISLGTNAVRNLSLTGPCPGVWADGAGVFLDLREVLIENTTSFGLVASRDAEVSAIDVIIRGTSASPDELVAVGAGAVSGSAMLLDHVLVEDTEGSGVGAGGATTTVVLDHAIVRDTTPRPDLDALGMGLVAAEGGRLFAWRTVLERNVVGALAFEPGTLLELEDVVMRDNGGPGYCRYTYLADDETLFPRRGGLVIVPGAHVVGSRLLLERNGPISILGFGPDAQLELSDVVVRQVDGLEGEGFQARGLNVIKGVAVRISRALFEEVHGYGLFVSDAATDVEITDLIVRDTIQLAPNLEGGWGLLTQMGANVRLDRAVIERSVGIGVIAAYEGTQVALNHAVVRETRHYACADDACADVPGGGGLVAAGGANITAESIQVSDNALCGLHLVGGRYSDEIDPSVTHIFENVGTMDLHYGEVARNQMCGANVLGEDYDLSRLTNEVIYYENNGRNLDATEMWVPSVSNPLD